MTPARVAGLAAAAAGALVVASSFFTATTFIGDDHLFLAFAHHAPNPFSPFMFDRHGGEYYRPIPMLVWWCLGRLGRGSPQPFAALALALHASAACLLAALLRALHRPPSVAPAAALLFFLAPQNLETAYWFSGSTDLLATVLALASLLALLRGRRWLAALFGAGAYLSKESAYVLPMLALVVVLAGERSDREGRTARAGPATRRVVALVAPLVLVLLARVLVLHGWGRAAEQHAGIFGIALQIASGFAHLYTGAEIVPEPLASALGTMLLGLVIWFLARQGRGLGRFAPLAFAALAVLPLGGAGWVVGSRFFYLPAIGICWAAGEALSALGPAAEVTAAAGLILLGGTAAARRRQDVVSYDRRVAAARRAVAAGLRDGHRVFHIDGDVKDLDLAVKEDPAIAPADVLVLGDVPASFAIIPPDLREAASILIARPPLPPGGSYRFGDTEVVGLARRGDDPELSDVLQRFPDLRFIRLRAVRGGMVIARDLTAEIREQLDDAALDGAASGESE